MEKKYEKKRSKPNEEQAQIAGSARDKTDGELSCIRLKAKKEDINKVRKGPPQKKNSNTRRGKER